jgi:hypothetical protein
VLKIIKIYYKDINENDCPCCFLIWKGYQLSSILREGYACFYRCIEKEVKVEKCKKYMELKDIENIEEYKRLTKLTNNNKWENKRRIESHETEIVFNEELTNMLNLCYKVKLKQKHFDYILFVPPTESGNLVKKMAEKLSKESGIPLLDCIYGKPMEPQKKMGKLEECYENVRNCYKISEREKLKDKSILLIDDNEINGAVTDRIAILLEICNIKDVTTLVLGLEKYYS